MIFERLGFLEKEAENLQNFYNSVYVLMSFMNIFRRYLTGSPLMGLNVDTIIAEWREDGVTLVCDSNTRLIKHTLKEHKSLEFIMEEYSYYLDDLLEILENK
jgi:hypothetical protein